MLDSLLSSSKRSSVLSSDVITAFDYVKAALADATPLTHFSPDTPISLMVAASSIAVGAVLQQKLSPAETRYGTFERELLVVFLAVTPSPPTLPSGSPLRSRQAYPRKIRQMDYISQFTSDIRQIDRPDNEVADAQSRPSIAHLQLSTGIDFAEMDVEQCCFGPSCDEDVSGLQLQDLPLNTRNDVILCDVLTSSHRPKFRISAGSVVAGVVRSNYETNKLRLKFHGAS
nr:unnamed protein product [Spirometra erinaceieuropaei]